MKKEYMQPQYVDSVLKIYLSITQQQWLMNSIFNYAKHLNLVVDFVTDMD